MEKTLWFGPKLERRPFTVFFSTASAHGAVSLDQKRLTVRVLEGQLAIDRIELTLGADAT